MGAFSDLLVELREVVGAHLLLEFRYWSDRPHGDSPCLWEVRYVPGYPDMYPWVTHSYFYGRTGEEALRALVEAVKGCKAVLPSSEEKLPDP